MKNYAGLLFALSAYTFWGLIPIFWKWLDHVAPSQIVAHRMVWSFVLVTALILLMGQGRQLLSLIQDRRQLARLGAASIFISVNWGIFIWAVNSGFLMETSMGYFINPLVNVLFGVLFFGERLRPAQQVSIAIAGVGVLIMVLGLGQFPWIAISLAITFSIYGVLKKSVSVPATHGMSVETLVMLVPAIAFLMISAKSGVGAFGQELATDALLILGGLFTLIPLILFAAAAKRVTLVTLGMTQYVGPTLQFLIAVFLFNEPLGTLRLVAFCFIWFALIVYTFDLIKERRQRRLALV